MLDIQPPEHTPHTWRDFFIHIGTIVIGLCIAIGLEQSVEAVHRHHEREQLRASLRGESEQILIDTASVETAMSAEERWQGKMGGMLADAAVTNQPIGQLPPEPRKYFNVPDDPIYKAAKASNELSLLSQQECQVYGEISWLIEKVNMAYQQRVDAKAQEAETVRRLRFHHPGITLPGGRYLVSIGSDSLSGQRVSPADLQILYDNTVHLDGAAQGFVYWSRQVRGAAVALKAGERNLQKIQAAESQFDHLN